MTDSDLLYKHRLHFKAILVPNAKSTLLFTKFSGSCLMSLSIAEKKRFRQIGHQLNPVVLLGNHGLTEAVLNEIDRALEDHELIKVRIGGEDREARRAAIEEMASATKSVAVQIIGKIVLLYRAAKKPNPKLSNIIRANQSV